jgi:hypothetical protein
VVRDDDQVVGVRGGVVDRLGDRRVNLAVRRTGDDGALPEFDARGVDRGGDDQRCTEVTGEMVAGAAKRDSAQRPVVARAADQQVDPIAEGDKLVADRPADIVDVQPSRSGQVPCRSMGVAET